MLNVFNPLSPWELWCFEKDCILVALPSNEPHRVTRQLGRLRWRRCRQARAWGPAWRALGRESGTTKEKRWNRKNYGNQRHRTKKVGNLGKLTTFSPATPCKDGPFFSSVARVHPTAVRGQKSPSFHGFLICWMLILKIYGFFRYFSHLPPRVLTSQFCSSGSPTGTDCESFWAELKWGSMTSPGSSWDLLSRKIRATVEVIFHVLVGFGLWGFGVCEDGISRF